MIDAQEQYRTRNWGQSHRYPFPILADPTARVCSLYGVAKQLMVHNEWVNLPAAFVVNKAGLLKYAHIGESFSDRATSVELLRVLDELQ